MIRILVVEDELIVGIALGEELQDLGAEAIVTGDAESAIQHLSQATIDAAIIDIELPGMRGDLFAKECRRRYPHLPIVVATGMQAKHVRAWFGHDPKLEVLEKPHDFHSVRSALARLGVVLLSVAASDKTPSSA